MDRLARALATVLGTGFLKPGPGTMGTIAGLAPAGLLLQLGGRPALAVGTVLVILLGTWATARYMRTSGSVEDPQEVVIDEVAGLWLALLPLASFDWIGLLAGFVAFRLFDIWKPGPVGWVDRNVHGAVGVMLDDMIAGLFAALCVTGVLVLFGRQPW
ncbi:MAG: phosphatidylglycerophosphatase A [Pseudomonadota bacterium]|nr:phosphatidylglycerophosphatase A [Pseudomonadota bacterium]